MKADREESVIDLAKLSERERELLALLAEGHTAKSIATHTGYSIASVNEHLRQARRKTGIGSSRQLARIATPPKNRDEKIEMAPPALAEPPRRSLRNYAKGAIVMGIVSAVVAAAFIFHQQSSPVPAQPAPVVDPLVDNFLTPRGQEPRRLAELVQSEGKDAAWADPAEAALRNRYAALVADRRIKMLRIACASTVCEIVGVNLDKDAKRYDQTMQDLQNPTKDELPPSVRLKKVTIMFGPEDRFISYWTRPS